MLNIGIIAPSSVVPKIELKIGTKILSDLGFQVTIHSQCKKKYLFFSGTDQERSQAIFEFAINPKIDILWCARGGYGSARLLPILDQLSKNQIFSKKILVGFSDATALLNYAYVKWDWKIIHAPMVTSKSFLLAAPKELQAFKNLLISLKVDYLDFFKQKLFFLSKPKKFQGILLGGNLTVLASLLGTPYEINIKNKVLFLEDINENLYCIDRIINQLSQSKYFEGCRGIILGTFTNCEDKVPLTLKKNITSLKKEDFLNKSKLTSLRKTYKQKYLLKKIFSQVNIPVVFGLQVGHQEQFTPLALGTFVNVSEKGSLSFKDF